MPRRIDSKQINDSCLQIFEIWCAQCNESSKVIPRYFWVLYNSIQASTINNNILQRIISQRPGSKPHHTELLKVQPHLTLRNPASLTKEILRQLLTTSDEHRLHLDQNIIEQCHQHIKGAGHASPVKACHSHTQEKVRAPRHYLEVYHLQPIPMKNRNDEV